MSFMSSLTRQLVIFALAGVVPAAGAMAGEHAPFQMSEAALVTERGRFVFAVEMALTPAQQAQGLQGRRSLAPSAGMLFDFGDTRPVAMWMKNTPLSLDMLFIDEVGVVVNIARDTTPLSLRTIPSAAPVRAVLELNAGTARRLGAKPGDRVLHPLFGADP